MNTPNHGIHHVTAIAGDPQRNLNFYSGLLGLRLVKQTVNFDDPATYHFYYGDNTGRPGTLVTFFPWTDKGVRGEPGNGQITTISFAVPLGALDYWAGRLIAADVDIEGPITLFDHQYLRFCDPDGIQLELVATENLESGGVVCSVPREKSIGGLFGVTISAQEVEPTAQLLETHLNCSRVGEIDGRYRFQCVHGIGGIIDIQHRPHSSPGRIGAGSVHHLAWRTANYESQQELRSDFVNGGFSVSPVLDRQYFRSIYFREPGGALFEIATDIPGFTVDESVEELGLNLQLPDSLRRDENRIREAMPAIIYPIQGCDSASSLIV